MCLRVPQNIPTLPGPPGGAGSPAPSLDTGGMAPIIPVGGGGVASLVSADCAASPLAIAVPTLFPVARDMGSGAGGSDAGVDVDMCTFLRLSS